MSALTGTHSLVEVRANAVRGGGRGADDLFNQAIENNVKHSQILRNQSVAKTAGKYGAGLVRLAGAGKVIGHMLE